MGENKKPVSRKEARPRWTEEEKTTAKKIRGNLSKEEKTDLENITKSIKENEEMFDMDLENVVEMGIGQGTFAKVPQSLVRKQINKVKRLSCARWH